MDLTVEIGLNQIQQQAALILKQNVNAKIDEINAAWATRDATWWTAMGLPNPLHAAEHISASNMHSGHVPSLIEAPFDQYPNLACIAHRGDPRASTDDWGEMYNVSLSVEIMVRSELVPQDKEFKAQLEVNARADRTFEAVRAVLATEANRTLNNLVPRIGSTPSVTKGDVFVRRESAGMGDRWFCQGVRLDYTVDKFSNYDD